MMDRAALAEWTKLSVHTIRARCPVDGYDRQGRAMYDADTCWKLLESVERRRSVAA